MKIVDEKGATVEYSGLGAARNAELAAMITDCLRSRPSVLVAIVGNKGVGKSLLGKYFRNHGIGRIHRRKIAVIDDDNMAVDMLCFFRRWYPHPCTGVDELRPFMKYCLRKPVRIYIKSNPESRISRADIVLRLTADESQRELRLIRRYGEEKGRRVSFQTRPYPPEIRIAYDRLMTAVI